MHLQRNQHEGWWAMSANPEVRIWVHAGGTGLASTSTHHAAQRFEPGDVLAITGTRTAWDLEIYTVAPGEERHMPVNGCSNLQVLEQWADEIGTPK